MLWIIFLFVTNFLFAQETVIETYCFSTTAQASKAQQSARYLMTAADQIETRGSCFSLFTTNTRRELIQKYLLNSYPDMRIEFSSVERSAKEMCDLLVEKTKSENSSNYSLNRIGQELSSGKEVTQLKSMSGAPFELRVDQQKIKGTCRYISPTRYEIEFTMEFIPRPIIPPTPPGTIVLINNPPAPQSQKGTNLSTTVQISQGERIEIGSIVKDLTDKGHAVSLIPSIEVKINEGRSLEKIYLMLNSL